MTPQNAREYIPLIEALADGELEYYDGYEWKCTKCPNFLCDPSLFRRKPKPTVVPWDRESCPVGAVVKYKETGNRFAILQANSGCVFLNQYSAVSFEGLLRNFTMDDGSPCGVVQK